jgi:hypothetical protein
MIYTSVSSFKGYAVAQFVEAAHYKVAGLIPDGVTGIIGSEVDSL